MGETTLTYPRSIDSSATRCWRSGCCRRSASGKRGAPILSRAFLEHVSELDVITIIEAFGSLPVVPVSWLFDSGVLAPRTARRT